MDASYQELWGPAALARAARNDLETPLENELGLLRAMRKRCGPFASAHAPEALRPRVQSCGQSASAAAHL